MPQLGTIILYQNLSINLNKKGVQQTTNLNTKFTHNCEIESEVNGNKL